MVSIRELLELLIDPEANIDLIRESEFFQEARRLVRTPGHTDLELAVRLRDIYWRALIFREAYLDGESTSDAFEQLVSTEEQLCNDATKLFTPFHQAVASAIVDLEEVAAVQEQIEKAKTAQVIPFRPRRQTGSKELKACTA